MVQLAAFVFLVLVAVTLLFAFWEPILIMLAIAFFGGIVLTSAIVGAYVGSEFARESHVSPLIGGWLGAGIGVGGWIVYFFKEPILGRFLLARQQPVSQVALYDESNDSSPEVENSSRNRTGLTTLKSRVEDLTTGRTRRLEEARRFAEVRTIEEAERYSKIEQRWSVHSSEIHQAVTIVNGVLASTKARIDTNYEVKWHIVRPYDQLGLDEIDYPEDPNDYDEEPPPGGYKWLGFKTKLVVGDEQVPLSIGLGWNLGIRLGEEFKLVRPISTMSVANELAEMVARHLDESVAVSG